MTDWAAGLPRPVAFVLSGGASLGASQVGLAHGRRWLAATSVRRRDWQPPVVVAEPVRLAGRT
jgi:hypothetical protein